MGIVTRFIAWIKSHYDKVIAVAVLVGLLFSLLYLAVKVGTVRLIQDEFRRNLNGLSPKHPTSTPVDPAPFERAEARLKEPVPFTLESWTNAMFVPEERVWCLDCKRPIPIACTYVTTLTPCPFCRFLEKRPENEPTYDGDRDGIYDVWEQEYKLDPDNPLDAQMDPDGDEFTSLEEFQANPQTCPTNAASLPPLEQKLLVEKVIEKPFMLRFMSVMKMPDGAMKFQLNLRDLSHTYFVSMNEKIEGFEVIRYEPKIVQRVVPSVSPLPRDVDVSELTVKRGDETYTLIKDTKIQLNEYTVYLVFARDKERYELKIGGVFDLKGNTYTLISIVDTAKETVLIRRQDDQEFRIFKLPSIGGS